MKIQDFENIVSQVKPFLKDYLEEKGYDLSKKINCINPDHDDSTPSANLVGASTNSPRLFCHGCQASYDIFDVIQILEDKPSTGIEWIKETLSYLATKYSIPIKLKDMTEEELYEIEVYRAYRAASKLIQPFQENPEGVFNKELARRGWEAEAIASYGIGSVVSYSLFLESLLSQGFSDAFLEEIELTRKDIFNENNLIFVWKDEKSRPIGFTARNILFEEHKQLAEKEGLKLQESKYINTRTSGLKINIFKKGDRFYGIHVPIEKQTTSTLYVFEGQADVVTAWHSGLYNAVAISGSALRTEHVHALKALGIYDIVLCLDGDEVGRQKTKEILEEKLAGNRDLKVRVIELPDGEDPDSFIRNNGLNAFKKLAHWSAFEWRLNQYPEEDDTVTICRKMIPFIVNESSPVMREQLCKALSKRTGISLTAITEELRILLDEKSHKKSIERHDAVERMISEIRRAPTEAETIVQSALTNLYEIAKKHDLDTLSSEDFVRSLDEQKRLEEDANSNATGFKLGKDLKELEDCLRGEWSEGVFLCLGGKPNVGKSALLAKIAYELATNNEDVCVIYHTIDDTASQLSPRFVSIAEGSCELTINMVRQPKYWIGTAGEYIEAKRDTGYMKLRKLAQSGRLIIKDLSHGGTLAFSESLIAYYQERYPDRRIVYILDNFHKLRDFEDKKDERVRFKQASEHVKGISIRKRCCILSTVEYHKLSPGTKPTNHNIGETQQIEYDANFIAHVYSEVADIPDSFTVCHKAKDWKGEKLLLPRIEIIVGKNKITEQKRSFFLDFFPASSDFKFVNQETVIKESAQMKAEKLGTDDSSEEEDSSGKKKWKDKKWNNSKYKDDIFGGLS